MNPKSKTNRLRADKQNTKHQSGFTLPNLSKRNLRGFTFIEILIVVGVLAVLATVAVLLLNPAQFIAEARDSRRISDLKRIDTALALAQNSLYETLDDKSGQNLVYVSLPDTNGVLDDNCGSSGEYPTLPTLATGWEYRCVASSSNLRNVNGTGWIPINFTSIPSTQSLLAVLPIDPSNNATTFNYYTYTRDANPNVYALTVKLDSDKSLKDSVIKDGGTDDTRYEIGASNSLWANASGLVGLWRMDESSWNNNCSALTVVDSSPNGNHGKSCPAGTGPLGGAVGKVNNAGNFDGSDDYINCGISVSLDIETLSISFWFNSNDKTTHQYLVKKRGAGDWWETFQRQTDGIRFEIYNGTTQFNTPYFTDYNTGEWYHLVATLDQASGVAKLYADGNVVGSVSGITDIDFPSSVSTNISEAFNTFNGLIDEVRIYNRVLSAEEILTIYNATK